MPADATALIVPRTRSLFFNNPFDKRPQEITLDEAKTWGLDDDGMGLIFARAKTTTSRFCFRLVLNAEKFICHKKSKRFRAFARLVKDADFHCTRLDEIEGSIVPIHYGMWLMDTGDWAGKVLFSITQWCGISWNELSHTRMNTEANRILVGRTFEALHDSGVDYGGLSGFDIFRHVVIDISAPGLTRDDLLNGKAPCYITGLSEAHISHQCMRRVPVLPLGSYLPAEEVRCEEISHVLVLLGFMKRSDTRVSASAALKWHDKYSELYPDADNLEVLIAQRARLYPEVSSVYDGQLTVSFEGDDEYPKAIILTIDSGGEREQTPDHPLDPLPVLYPDSLSPEPDASEMVAAKLGRATLGDSVVAFEV
ncbi:hypothetical protein DFH08DRAFT_831539 [Mycena albidolilacea]|uniref:Uncharacterized protein n=1 Tax=Mycena albidolilacea TaxID=1033008 RepID=A0AAD7AUZ1_9AGAR|nr:hypothetical protein DFH08DRAFT_831539 [Mycena albidolilacea]